MRSAVAVSRARKGVFIVGDGGGGEALTLAQSGASKLANLNQLSRLGRPEQVWRVLSALEHPPGRVADLKCRSIPSDLFDQILTGSRELEVHLGT